MYYVYFCIHQAQSLYNSVAVRLPEDNKIWLRKAYKTQQAYWSGSINMSLEEQLKHTKSLTDEIESIRNVTRSQLEIANNHADSFGPNEVEKSRLVAFIDSIKQTSVDCTNDMISLASHVMELSVGMTIEEPPCPFSVVAIGSLARGEATPYSDLEYMFLLDRKNPTIEKYFERLAVTTYFLMGNMRETKLSYIAVSELRGWFDDKSKNGFKIDGLSAGAGNIPTGNGNPNSKNHFIATPKEMAARYQNVLNNPDKKEALRGDLTAMMAYMKSIFTYRTGFKLLPELKRRIAKMSSNSQRRAMNMEMLRNDMAKFDFKPDFDLRHRGFTVDVKKELYRFPSLLLYDISIIFYQHGDTVWDTVEKLHECELISDHIRLSIMFQLACACYVRLSTYLYHDSHDDRVSLAPTVSPVVAAQHGSQHSSEMSNTQTRWVMPGNLLLAMCRHMVPLKQALAKRENIFEVLKSNVTSPDWLTEVEILHSCGRYRDAVNFLTELFGSDLLSNTSEFVEVLKQTSHPFPELTDMIGDIFYDCGEYKLAMDVYKSNPHTNNTGQTNSRKMACNYQMANLDGAIELGLHTAGPLLNSISGAMRDNKDLFGSSRRKSSVDMNNPMELLGRVTDLASQISKRTNPNSPAHMELKNMAYMSNRFLKDVMSKPGATGLDMMEGAMVYSLEIYLKSARKDNNYMKLRIHDQVGTFLHIDHELDDCDADLFSMTPLQRLDHISEYLGQGKDQYLFMSIILKLGELYYSQRKHDLAEVYLHACLPMLADLCGGNVLVQEAGLIYGTLGKNSMATGQRTNAREYFKRAIHIYSELHGDQAGHVTELKNLLTELDIDSIAIAAYADEELD